MNDSQAHAKEEDLIKRISVKAEIDHSLLDDLKQNLKGDVSGKKKAVTTFFENYKNVPHEADELIANLAKQNESIEITRLLAKYFADEKIRLSARVELELLKVLRKSKDNEVQKLIEKKKRKYDEYFENIKKMLQNSAYSFHQYQERIQNAIDSSFQQSLKSIYEIQQIVNYSVIHDWVTAYNEIYQATNKLIFLPYYSLETISEIKVPAKIPETTFEQELINKLLNCPEGEEGWKEYQDICESVIEYLFVPPLGDPTPQDRSDDGVHVRDYILQIPYDLTGFWSFCQFTHNCVGVVIEIKNKSKLKPNDVVITAKYLDSKRIGNFGIILTRGVPSKNVKHEIERIWKETGKLIVVVTDSNIIDMIKMKKAGDEPEKLIEKLIFDFRRSLD